MTRTEVRVKIGNTFPNTVRGYSPTLLDLCLDVKGSCNGSADAWHLVKYLKTRDLLQEVLETWDTDTARTINEKLFDDAVFSLIHTTISMIESELNSIPDKDMT